MEICFEKKSRKVALPNNVDELWSAIVHEIPGLLPHKDKLQMRYIDDEGDDISVTTDDELQEGICVGKETSKGFLSLNLSVPGIRFGEIIFEQKHSDEEVVAPLPPLPDDESTVLPPLPDDESTDEEEYVVLPPLVPVRNRENPTQPNVLQAMKAAGESAVSEINQALNLAAAEINKMLNQLGSATTKNKKTEEELASVKGELSTLNSKYLASEQQVVKLTNDLDITKALLAESTQQVKSTSKRLKELEKQVSEKAMWEKKCQVAEEERAKVEQELHALRSALQVLSLTQTTPTTPIIAKTTSTTTPMTTKPTAKVTTKPTAKVTTKPTPVSAEVVSNEIIPSSPVMESANSPELPPPYETPVVTTPVAATSFPENCPAPTPLELKRQKQLQQLAEMGFDLTLEQLNEKLQEHSYNMQHVITSLL